MRGNERIDRRQAMAGLAAVTAVAGSGVSRASAQSGSIIRIIYPYAAGGTGDVVVRLLADKMQTILDQPVVVENRTGAAGRLGVNAVKNSAPDGLTLLYTPFAAMTIYPFVYRQLDYDPFTEFQPLSQIVKFDFAIAVGPDVPAKTPKELVAWLKANPSKAQYGSPGAGALPHFFGLLFGKAAGVEMTHVAYRGTAPALPDLMGGQIPMVSSTTNDFLELHKSGKIRIIATSDVERSVPDVPTFKESGIDITGTGWYGMFLPAKTPPDVVARLSKAVMQAVAMPEVTARYVGLGFKSVGSTPEELGRIQKEDAAKWQPIVKASGFIAD
jgi:tripartite-type tricarboxylate transporter receptor subunit TctC